MVDTYPVIPLDIKFDVAIADMIKEYCPISQMEIVHTEDPEHKIYKFVGLCSQNDVSCCIPSHYTCQYFKRGIVSLYERASGDENVCVFWHDQVLVVMISNTEDQHEGVMNHYGDVGILLTQVGNSYVVGQLRNQE